MFCLAHSLYCISSYQVPFLAREKTEVGQPPAYHLPELLPSDSFRQGQGGRLKPGVQEDGKSRDGHSQNPQI